MRRLYEPKNQDWSVKLQLWLEIIQTLELIATELYKDRCIIIFELQLPFKPIHSYIWIN